LFDNVLFRISSCIRLVQLGILCVRRTLAMGLDIPSPNLFRFEN